MLYHVYGIAAGADGECGGCIGRGSRARLRLGLRGFLVELFLDILGI